MKKSFLTLTTIAFMSFALCNLTLAVTPKHNNRKKPDNGLVNLGLIDIKSFSGRYLQAHQDNGETHASNDNRHTEETWYLVQVDATQHIYAFVNYSNTLYLSLRDNGCAIAVSPVLGPSEEWRLVSGLPYGMLNAVSIVSVANGNTLWANDPGQDTSCGGEVSAGSSVSPEPNSGWHGWFVMEACDVPTEGPTAGDIVNLGLQYVQQAADVAKVIAAIAASF